MQAAAGTPFRASGGCSPIPVTLSICMVYKKMLEVFLIYGECDTPRLLCIRCPGFEEGVMPRR